MRNAEVIRQWKILKTIEAGRYTTAGDLADEHDVTERTIRRDIEALQEAGFPLYDDRVDGRKVWRLVDGYKQRLTQSFTLAELAALYFGRNMMSFLGGAPFAQDLESAFGKIHEALPARSLPYLARIQELFSARPDPFKDYSKKQDVIAAPHRRDPPPAPGPHRLLLVQQPEDQELHDRPLPPRLLPRRPLPLRARPRVRRGAHLRGGAHPEDRGARRGLRDPHGLQRLRVRAGRLRHRGRQARRRWSSSSPRRWRATSASASGTRASAWRTGRTARVAPAPSRWPRAGSSSPGSRASCPTCGWCRPASLRDEIARDLDKAARKAFPAPSG